MAEKRDRRSRNDEQRDLDEQDVKDVNDDQDEEFEDVETEDEEPDEDVTDEEATSRPRTARGVRTIALRCGGGWSEQDLAGALAIFDDPLDLLINYDDSPLVGRGEWVPVAVPAHAR